MWVDAPDANPAEDLKAILDEHGCRGRKLGVEYEAYGLTGRSAKRVDAALEGFCELEDASDVVNRLRVVKSPAELEYVRRAAVLAACQAALVPGRIVGDVFAAYADTLTRRGITGFANACGYCLGTTFSPNWMDWPMFYRDNPVVVEPGMVFFHAHDHPRSRPRHRRRTGRDGGGHRDRLQAALAGGAGSRTVLNRGPRAALARRRRRGVAQPIGRLEVARRMRKVESAR